MRTIPRELQAIETFFLLHAARWSEDPAAVGLTPEAVAELEARAQAFLASRRAQSAAKQAAKAATNGMREALESLLALGAPMIEKIRATASAEGGDVYSAAQINPPRAPGASPALSRPDNFSTELLPDGALMLRWKCRQPESAVGTVYQIRRSVDGGPLVSIGISGKKKFLDRTLPRGTAMATYWVQAARSTGSGPVATFNVSFGTGGGAKGLAIAA